MTYFPIIHLLATTNQLRIKIAIKLRIFQGTALQASIHAPCRAAIFARGFYDIVK